LRLGLRALSVAPGEILGVQQRIRTIDLAEARPFAQSLLELGTPAEIEDIVAKRLLPPTSHSVVPDRLIL
jgi:phosphoenolpyruvate-protein kinase (PTS system EI component)